MSNNNVKYFDLHTKGVGYLSRVRKVSVKKGPGFLACDISALRGSSDAVEYTRFDCRVSGTEAQKVIEQVTDAANDKTKKVLIGFNIGDLYAETFTYEQGPKAGQAGVSLKGHLLRIAFVKVDGNTVYSAPKADEAPADAEADAPEAAAA